LHLGPGKGVALELLRETGMSGSRLKSVELSLAETGSELVPVLRAAQFARFVRPAEPETEGEAQAMEAFIASFASSTEAWEEADAAGRAGLLAALSQRLAALETAGLFVHAGATALALPGGGQEVPVAIVTIGRSAVPSLSVMVPVEVDIQGPASTH
jgi:hypothetical protein